MLFFYIFLGPAKNDNFLNSIGNIVSVIVPIIETLFSQYGILKILKSIKFFTNKTVFNIFISAIVFSLAHSSSWSLMIFTFINGIFLAYSFVIYEEKKYILKLNYLNF